ncbi:site-specific DNA-methyltransferase [Tepidiphilus thermophilus]|uniref:site-specific DNA-methyltransferase (adenine-specific) n=1 Tax=Tepidiphilus thermophilus TaxID=876478 RepID=A0A0K6IP30_9PROT|nr:site-specific DNA-methyltransferase [Tepidiphilus thermophilus]CUB04858.1 DNA methylase [Tepidiphilus thermophilus]
MPTLNWIGKDAVVKHHKDVPFRLLEPVADLSCGPADSGNLIVQGDNLHALKALLPRYAGQVKCIYIDPPYNTGNEGWVYNDNVNSPEIRKWLGEVVGKEGETLDRHDRWLCMMYPRLVLLRQFLREDGAIFVSIDDNEVASLKFLMDEIFGRSNYIAQIEWQKRYTRSNNTSGFTTVVEHILAYAKSSSFSPNLVAKGEEANARYSNPDNDPRGPWKAIPFLNPLSPKERPNLAYDIIQPNTGEILRATRKAWRASRDIYEQYLSENRIYWGKDGKSKTPTVKRFLSEVRDGMPPVNFWDYRFAAHTDIANQELKAIFGDKSFPTPKPTLLIQRILQIATDKDSLILDSFAGSGTTAHAVLKQNAEDGGKRRFILVEMDPGIAQNVTAERVRRVAQGYTNAKGQAVAGLGGGFQFCRLCPEPLFDADGQIRGDVTFAQLAEFVWFVETGTGFSGTADSPLLGIFEGRAIYLLYNGILKDKSADGGNVLTSAVFEALPPFAGPKVIYAAACRLGNARLAREGIIFKQTPYALEM